MNRLKILFIILSSSILLLGGCSSAQSDSLTKEEATNLLAEYYKVPNQDIQITNFTSVDENYSVSHKVKMNGQWEPEDSGYYLAQIKKNETGNYTVTLPKFNNKQ